MQSRLEEMKERRKRLVKFMYKKEGRLFDFEKGYISVIQKKNSVINSFSNA
jgi:hypothetical protein